MSSMVLTLSSRTREGSLSRSTLVCAKLDPAPDTDSTPSHRLWVYICVKTRSVDAREPRFFGAMDAIVQPSRHLAENAQHAETSMILCRIVSIFPEKKRR